MKLISLSEETAGFLTTLMERMATQDNQRTQDPFFYTVRCDKEIAVPNGTTGDKRYFDPDSACSLSEQELREQCEEDDVDFDEYVSESCQCYDVDTIDVDENVFLTLEGYEEHMKLNAHNYRHYKGHRSYLQHAFRNPEMAGLIKSLKEVGTSLKESASADSCLQAVCNALGWQGGTIHQVIDEIKRLRSLEVTV